MGKKAKAMPNPFAESEGVLYCLLPFSFLIACADGLPLTYFNGNMKQPYMTVDEAIAWHEKEGHLSKTQTTVLEVLRRAKAAFERGNSIVSDDGKTARMKW